MRSHDVVYFYESAALIAATPQSPRAFDVRVLEEPQGEGLAWIDDATLLLSGEGSRGGTLARVSCVLP
jgi:hypothetical protein